MKTEFLTDLNKSLSSHINDVIWQYRHWITRAALDGEPIFAHEAIGEIEDDINSFARELGMVLVHRSRGTDDPAVYVVNDDSREWAIVADCNGPIVIRPIEVNA